MAKPATGALISNPVLSRILELITKDASYKVYEGGLVMKNRAGRPKAFMY